MAEIQGTCPDKFGGVKKAFQGFLDDKTELGASITVSIDGEEVLDLWGGYKDKERTQAWEKDTIVNVYSSTKTVSALAVLMLIDQGKIDAFEKVSKYWPEFAQNGKENVEVRHFLSHASGVSAWEQPVTVEDVYDLKRSTERLAEQAPWWEPCTASGYHSANMGHLLGELVRRVTGKSLTQFIAEDIAGPLDADFQIGAAEKDLDRIAPLCRPPPLAIDFSTLPQDSVMRKTFTGPAVDAEIANTAPWRKAEIGAANGHSNARGLNRALRAVSLGGTANGKKILSQKTIDLIFQEQFNGTDLVLGQPIRYGIGYGLRHPEGTTSWMPPGRVCFWGGWGGSIVIMDVERKMTVTYAMNKMEQGTIGNERTMAYVKEIYHALGVDDVGTIKAPVAVPP